MLDYVIQPEAFFLSRKNALERDAMNLTLGTRIQEQCPNCKEKVKGIVTRKGVASFDCSSCKMTWELKLTESKGKGSRFTAEELKKLLDKNPSVKVKF